MIFKILRIGVFSLLLVLVSCNKTKTKKPKNLIPKDKMVDLLFDMHMANRSRNIVTKNKEKKPNYFPLIYKKHHIDSTQFKESHAYYMQELPEYIAIYQKLEDSIFSLLKEKEALLKEKDSINKLKKKKKLLELKDINLDKKLLKPNKKRPARLKSAKKVIR